MGARIHEQSGSLLIQRRRNASLANTPEHPGSDLIDRLGVAYVHRCAVETGFIWRELTGQDIGIDAAVELPATERPMGHILLQVKTSAASFDRPGDKIAFSARERHHEYWLLQRLPVVLCLVECRHRNRGPTPLRLTLLDFGRLDRVGAVQFGKRGCSVVRNLAGPAIKYTKPPWTGVREWLLATTVNPTEAIASRSLQDAERLIEGGEPDRALQIVRELLGSRQISLVRPAVLPELVLKKARVLRRLGKSKEASEALKQLDGHSMPVAKYEKAFVELLRCMENPSNADWARCQKLFEEGSASRRPLKDQIIRATEALNAASYPALWSRPGLPSVPRLLAKLEGRLEQWKSEPHSQEYWHRRLNALGATCRGYLALGKLAEAERAFEALRTEFSSPSSYHTAHLMVAILQILEWLCILRGKQDEARVVDACAELAFNAVRPDRQIHLIARRLRTLLKPRGRQ
ncbi:MAG: DUF4365 domain-containing protein [Acidobacteriota bacterium]